MITFILNNKKIVTSAKSGMTLLDFIRDTKQLKGTKIGCREGDCGACTVLVGSLDNNTINYKSITSCISPLGNANGKHIVTIEGVNIDNELNVAQQVMANNYATQCGFCTPGFVVSMTGQVLKKKGNQSTCLDAISGNICRCTGYKSIEKATEDLETELAQLKNDSVEELIAKKFIPKYFSEIPSKLKALEIDKLAINNQNTVANGTDIYVRFADDLADEELNLIGENEALKGIDIKNKTCILGASTTVTEIIENKALNKAFPKLKSFLKLVSSEQIRNMGTLGGNFVNASPIGDMSVFFLALNSRLVIKNKTEKTRTIPFANFHQDYKKYDLQQGEIIQNIQFELPLKNTYFNFEKVSKRTHLDIASVNSACSILINESIISTAIISIGGVAAIPKVLEKTNQFLTGKSISISTIIAAEKVLQSEISPISDVRGSIEYKRLLAKQLFFAHFIELFPKTISLQGLIKY